MKTHDAKPPLILTGASGNAFAILEAAIRAAKMAGWTAEEIAAYRTEAISGDYDHLLQTTLLRFDVS